MIQAHSHALVTKNRKPSNFWQACVVHVSTYSGILSRSLRRHPLRAVAITSVSLAGLTFIPMLAYPSMTLNFAAQTTCATRYSVLPSLQRVSSHSTYRLSFENTVDAFGFPLISRQVCVHVSQPPEERTGTKLYYSFAGIPLLRYPVQVTTISYAKLLNPEQLTAKAISTKQPLVFKLSASDQLFTFAITSNGLRTACVENAGTLTCPVSQLGLKQGKVYTISVERYFDNRLHSSIFSARLKTTEPIYITKKPFRSGTTLYKPVRKVAFTASQPLSVAENVYVYQLNGSKRKLVQHKTKIKNKQIVISFPRALEWRSSYRVKIGNLLSTTNGELARAYSLTFRTAGGPRVTGANMARYGVSATQTFTVSFDQQLGKNQSNLAVELRGPAGKERAFLAVQGSRLVVDPVRTLARCTTYTLRTGKTFSNPYGVQGDSAWSYQFRTRCAQTSTIGYSVQGRPIVAYRFGSGASKIIFVGAMHGTEAGSKYTLDSWVNDLEANPGRIPRRRTLIIIPNTNPDGVAHGTRTNSRGVDLNRNFPADDWQSGVYMPGPTYLPKGGGKAPLSEPESRALANYIVAQSPRLVLTYHGAAAVVIGNGSGDSNSLARLYAGKSGYQAANDSHADGIFGYATTGEFEDWLHDKKGMPTLLIEQASSYGNEFTRNRPALWAMVTLP